MEDCTKLLDFKRHVPVKLLFSHTKDTLSDKMILSTTIADLTPSSLKKKKKK